MPRRADQDGSVAKAISEVHVDRVAVPYDKIDRMVDLFKRKFKYPTTAQVVQAVASMEVVPVFSPGGGIEVPTFVPAWLVDRKKYGVIAVANLSNYHDVKEESDGSIDGDPRLVFAVLQAAFLAKRCHDKWDAATGNYAMAKESAAVYAKLFCKVLDKMYSVKAEEYWHDVISYWAAKFMLVAILGRGNTESADDAASSAAPGRTTKASIIASLDGVDQDRAFADLKGFTEMLSAECPLLSRIDVRSFMLNWTTLYGGASVMAIDFYPAFLWTVCGAAVSTTKFVNTHILENTLKGSEAKILSLSARVLG